MNSIRYQYGNDLDLDQVIELYNASTLGERRPVEDRQVMADMLRHANLVVTAWDGDLLVGIARTLTDFSYVGYLSDLAVKASHQRKGIGIQLVQKPTTAVGARARDERTSHSADTSKIANASPILSLAQVRTANLPL